MSEGLDRYRAIVERDEAFRRAGTVGTLSYVSAIDPDLAAEGRRLAKKYSVHGGPLSKEMIEELQARERHEVQIESLEGSPGLGDWFSKPQNAAVAHDDVENLSALSNAIADSLAPVTDPIRQFGADSYQATGMGVSGLGHTLDMLSRNTRGLIGSIFGQEAADAVREFDRSISFDVSPGELLADAGEWFKGQGKSHSVPQERQTFATKVGGAFGQIGTQASTYLLNPMAAFAMLYGMGVDQQAEQLKEEGVDLSSPEAQVAMATGGAITVITEKVGLDRVLDMVPVAVRNRALSTLWSAFKAGGTEAASEAAENMLHNATTYIAADLDKNFVDYMLAGSGEEAAVAGTAGALVNLLVNAAIPGHHRTAERGASETKARVQAMTDAAARSMVRGRSPEAFRAAVRSMQQNGEGSVIYLPAIVVSDYFQQSAEDLDAIGSALGLGPNQFEQAAMAQHDVAVPIDAYLALDDDAHAAFADHARLDPEGLTVAEVAAGEAELQAEELKAEINRRAREVKEGIGEVAELRSEIRAHMIEAGLPSNEAEHLSAIMAAMYGTMAEREGKPLAEFLASVGGLPAFRVEAPEVVSGLDDEQLDALLDEARHVEPGGDMSEGDPTEAQTLAAFLDNAGIDFRNESNLRVRSLLRKQQYSAVSDATTASTEPKGGLEGLDANVLGSVAALIMDDPAYSSPDADQVRLSLLPEAADALRGAGISLSDNGTITRADAERLLEERDRRNSRPRSAEPDGAHKPVGEAGPARDEQTLEQPALADVIRRIREVVAAAKENTNAKVQALIGGLRPGIVREARKAGVDLSGLTVSVDAYGVGHALNRHSDPKEEAAIGQIALTEKDFERLPDIVADPDIVVIGFRNRRRLDQVSFVKTLGDGSTLVVTEARRGKRELAFESMRKYPPRANVMTTIMAPLAPNVQDDGGIESRIITRGDIVNAEGAGNRTLYQDDARTVPRLTSEQINGVDPETGDHSGLINSSVPTNKRSKQGPRTNTRSIGLSDMMSKPDYLDHHVGLVNDYVGTPNSTRSLEPDKAARAFVEQMRDNLLFLYNRVPPAERELTRRWYDDARDLVTSWAEKYGIPDTGIAGVIAALSPQMEWEQNVLLAERMLDIWTKHQASEWTKAMDDAAERIYGKKPKLARALRTIREKRLGDILTLGLPEDAVDLHIAMWVRIYDKAHSNRGDRADTPGGESIDVPSGKVSWFVRTSAAAKAISVIRNPSVENVSRKMGEAHKVRSFYNNILAPNAPHGDVTVDRHAVAAALGRPLPSNAVELAHNFNGWIAKDKQPKGWKRAKRDGDSGATGTYGFYAEAYRLAAEILGIQPRELQSITRVASRRLFGGHEQKKNVSVANEIWQAYRDGKASIEEVRKDVYDLAGGIGPDGRDGSGGGHDAVLSDTHHAGELPGDGLSGRPAGAVDGGAGSAAAGAAADLEPRELKQGAAKASPRGSIVIPKGGITQGRTTISLFVGRDRSTVLHELSHYMLELLRVSAEMEGAPTKVREMWAEAKKALGLENLRPGDPIPTEAHERWARWGEAYFATGKAPSAELQPAFDRFRDWMLQVWAYVKRVLGKEVETRVPAEVRTLFDRMLAADQQAAQAERVNQTQRVFDDASAAAMTPEQWAAYVAQGERARSEARNRVQRAVVEEDEERKRKPYRDALKAARAEARTALAKRREFQAREVLTNGRFPVAGGHSGEPGGAQDIRLDRQALIDMGYGRHLDSRSAAGASLTFPRGRHALYTDKGGLHPDVVAGMFGYESGREMLDDLLVTPRFEEAVESEAQRIVKARFGDLLNDGGIATVALESLHSGARARLLEMELAALSAKAPASEGNTGAESRQAAREVARHMLAGMAVANAGRADLFLAAERRGARGTLRALTKGDAVAARQQKWRQFINFQLWSEAQAFGKERAAAEALFRRATRRRDLAGKGDDSDFVMATRVMLGRFGLAVRPQRFDLEDWLSTLQADDPQTYEEIGRAIAVATSPAQDWRTLTVAGYRHLIHAVQSLVGAAERRRTVELEGRRVDLEKSRQLLLNRISGAAKYPERTRELAAGLDAFLLSTDAAMHRVESWARLADGRDDGPVARLIARPVRGALEAYRAERARRIGRAADILRPLLGRAEATGAIMAPELGGFRFEHKGEVLAALLNTGTGSNARRLFEGFGWSEAGWQAFMGRLIAEGKLGREDFDAVQAIWDVFEDMRGPAGRAHRAIYGHDADRVPARPLATPFGSYRGGWVLVVLDKSRRVADQGRGMTMFLPAHQSSGLFPIAAEGLIAGREVKGRALLDLSLRALPGHVDKVLRFTHLQPVVRRVARILSGPEFRQVVAKTNPQLIPGLLVPWLQRTALQTVETPTSGRQLRWFEPVLRFARRSAGAGPLVREVVDALQPLAGAMPARVRSGSLARGLFLYYVRPGAATRFIFEQSPSMRGRLAADAKAAMGDLRDLLGEPSLQRGGDAFAKDWVHVLRRIAERMTLPPLWLAAFDEASERGLPRRQAARHADAVVRGIGGGMALGSLPPVEAGGTPGRAVAMLLAYFRTSGPADEAGGRATTLARQAAVAASVVALPAVLGQSIGAASRGVARADNDTTDALRFVVDAQVHYILAMLPLLKPAGDGKDSSPPAAGTGEEYDRAASAIERQIAEGGEEASTVKDALTAVMMLFGIGGGDAIGQAAGYAAGVAGQAIGGLQGPPPALKFDSDFLSLML